MVIYDCGNEAKVGDKVLRFDSNAGTLAVGEYVVTGVRSWQTIVIDIDSVPRPFSTEYFTLISRKGKQL